MAYDFKTDTNGNVITSQNGQTVSTGSAADAATRFGYVAPVSVKAATSSPSVISSATGADIVGQQTQKLNQLSAVPTTQTMTGGTTTGDSTTSAKSDLPQPISTKVTLINPDTEQTITYEDAAINKEGIQQYMNAGYKLSEASGKLPDWLVPSGVSNTQTDAQKAQSTVDTAAADLKALTDNLSKFTVSDADLQQQIQGITALWQSRIADMGRVNESREGSINTLGVRLGSRFAGGKGGSFGGIIAEEERQGVQRIADLEGQKQAAIAAAKTAALTQNWSVYSKQIDVAQKAYEDKVKALADLQKATADQNKLIADAIQQSKKDTYDQVTKPINDIYTDLAKIPNVPKDVLTAVQSAPTLAEAVRAAGTWLQGGTGVVGEWVTDNHDREFRGLAPQSFTEYQNQDANRKIRIQQAANAAGLTATMTNTALKLSDDYEARSKDFYTQRDAYNRVISSATDPSAAGDLALIFNYMKTLDPGSTVREGEFATAQNSGSAFSIAGAKYNKVVSGERLTQAQRDDFVKRAGTIFEGSKAQQDKVAEEFTKRAGQYGVPANLVVRDTSATGMNPGTQAEQEAQDALVAASTANVPLQNQIFKLLDTLNTDTGHKMTYLEVQQYLRATGKLK